MEGQRCFPVHSGRENNENQKVDIFNHGASVVWDATKDVKKKIRKRKNKIENKSITRENHRLWDHEEGK